MKRIAFTLILSIVVFVATIVTTNIYVSQKSTETATYLNDVVLDNFSSDLDGDVRMTEQSVRCFLSGQRFLSVSDSTTLVIDEQHLKGFKKGIYDNLLQFMKVNKYYDTSMFIIDADINHDYYGQEGCYAPSVKQGDSALHVLSDHYDFMRSPNYQQVKKERKLLWTVPSSLSPVAGQYMTLYMPIMLSNGCFFGAFAVALDVQMINRKLKKHLPYGEESSAIFIADEDNHIFSAYPGWVMDYREDYEKALNSRAKGKHAGGSLKFEYEGEDYCGFSRPTNNVPWTICTICQADKIYEEADNVKRIIFVTSFLGMLLMLICCIVISRQIRKDLRKKAAVEEELKMAAKVQMSLLKPQNLITSQPHHLQTLICPAKEVGGDLYDYVEKDGELIFCIGDVSGKGMPAALFMTQVVSLFRNAVRNTSDPAQIASQINDVLAGNNPDMTFCTCFVGVLHEDTLTFCNAGHNPPVLLSQAAPSFLKVKPNIALGLMEGYPYKSEVIRLGAGDSLLLYTDGVTEAKNRARKEFGEERLLKALSQPGPDAIATVLDKVHAFVDHYEQSDDITMMIISRYAELSIQSLQHIAQHLSIH